MADQIFNAKSGFYDAVNLDRLYTADDMNKPYSRVIADGVFATNQGTPSSDLQVVSTGTGMQISVMAGQGIFGAKWFQNEGAVIITVPDNTAIDSRIDSAIIQIDKRVSGRVGSVVYRTGTPSVNPQPPEINTIEDVIEYRLANITVAPGTELITNKEIVDLRGTDECPWVTSLIQQVDTSTLWLQYQTAFQQLYEAFTRDYDEYTEEQRQAWEDFISHLTQELTVSTSITTLSSYYVAEGEVQTVPINISSFNPDTDVLMVFINGLMADSTKYTLDASNTSITLTKAIAAGNSVSFIVFKSIIGGNIESTVSMLLRLDDKLNNFMSDSGWVSLTLARDVSPFDVDTVPAVRCIGNRVYIRGAVKGITQSGALIGTLPVSFRPAKDHLYASFSASGVTVQNSIILRVYAATGELRVFAKSFNMSANTIVPIATNFLSNTGNNVSMVYNYMGSVETYSALPAEPNVGDVYMIESADPTHYIEAGDDVLWNGAEWELLDTVISSEMIDTIINSIS